MKKSSTASLNGLKKKTSIQTTTTTTEATTTPTATTSATTTTTSTTRKVSKVNYAFESDAENEPAQTLQITAEVH